MSGEISTPKPLKLLRHLLRLGLKIGLSVFIFDWLSKEPGIISSDRNMRRRRRWLNPWVIRSPNGNNASRSSTVDVQTTFCQIQIPLSQSLHQVCTYPMTWKIRSCKFISWGYSGRNRLLSPQLLGRADARNRNNCRSLCAHVLCGLTTSSSCQMNIFLIWATLQDLWKTVRNMDG